MKPLNCLWFSAIAFVAFLFLDLQPLYSQDAREIVRRADEKMQGSSSYGEMEMSIIRPTWKRTVSVKSWAKGRDLSLALITAPAKESGQSFLKIKNEMWNWNPTINRMIKLPPSMMSQGWMGSDYTNDDMLKESSVVNDYSHSFIKKDKYAGTGCYVIELIPLESAAVVWGKIILWISEGEYLEMKAEFYDEEGALVKTHLASEVKFMHDRRVPTHYEIIPADKPNQKTVLLMKVLKFNIALKDQFFTQQNMKNVK